VTARLVCDRYFDGRIALSKWRPAPCVCVRPSTTRRTDRSTRRPSSRGPQCRRRKSEAACSLTGACAPRQPAWIFGQKLPHRRPRATLYRLRGGFPSPSHFGRMSRRIGCSVFRCEPIASIAVLSLTFSEARNAKPQFGSINPAHRIRSRPYPRP